MMRRSADGARDVSRSTAGGSPTRPAPARSCASTVQSRAFDDKHQRSICVEAARANCAEVERRFRRPWMPSGAGLRWRWIARASAKSRVHLSSNRRPKHTAKRRTRSTTVSWSGTRTSTSRGSGATPTRGARRCGRSQPRAPARAGPALPLRAESAAALCVGAGVRPRVVRPRARPRRSRLGHLGCLDVGQADLRDLG